MSRTNYSNRLHSLHLFLMSLIFLISLFLKLSPGKLLFMYGTLLPFMFNVNSSLKEDIKKIGFVLITISMLVLLRVIYANESISAHAFYALRMFFLFSISMFAFSAIDFDSLFIYLMSIKKLKVEWGYALLLSMNSLHLLKKEQERITYNAKLRGLKWHQRYLTFFPLLIFAIRHSERGAMALVTRGLNPDKLFYSVWMPTTRDHVILGSFLLLTITFFLVG